MKDAAEKDGIKIKIVSGLEIFTGNKQSGIINTKNSQKSFIRWSFSNPRNN